MIRALTNPTRIRILHLLGDGPATPRQISSRVGEKRAVVGYHLRVLRATGCIRQVEGEQLGGADQRSYELAPSATPTRELGRTWPIGSGIGHPPAAVVRSVVERSKTNRGEDLFGTRQNLLSCASVVVDKRGWQEISVAIGEALDRISNAHERSMQRLNDNDEERIEATIAVASFETSARPAA